MTTEAQQWERLSLTDAWVVFTQDESPGEARESV